MIGLDATTGAPLDGLDHLRQSVRDILTTPIGSRVMRRDYGSALPDLVDGNVSGLTLAQFYAATADALDRWEPRLRVTSVAVDEVGTDLIGGQISISIAAEYLPDGREIRLDGIVL